MLRDGKLVWTRDAAGETRDSLVGGVLGRSLDGAFPPSQPPPSDPPVRLAVRGLSRPGLLHEISFDLREGEILGLAGLVGSGRSELAHALFGADKSTGTLLLDGHEWKPSSSRGALRSGISLLPESRKHQGLMLQSSIAYNLTLPVLKRPTVGGVISGRRKKQAVEATIQAFDIRPADGRLPVRLLSGGNQQKTMFGRCLATEPRVLIVDEPTRGVDVGAKPAIYNLLVKLASEGCAVLLISSEIEEILGLAYRILAINSGRIVAELPAGASEERLLQAMFDRAPRESLNGERSPANV